MSRKSPGVLNVPYLLVSVRSACVPTTTIHVSKEIALLDARMVPTCTTSIALVHCLPAHCIRGSLLRTPAAVPATRKVLLTASVLGVVWRSNTLYISLASRTPTRKSCAPTRVCLWPT